MTLVDIVVLGVALAMDAFAVTISNMLAHKDLRTGRAMLMPVLFAVFQFGMPLIGYFAGSLVAGFIGQYAGIITFVILGYIGIMMIKESLSDEDDEDSSTKTLTVGTLVFQAIATSIDALGVGFSFAALGVKPLGASAIIGITTFLCICIALGIGRRFGHKLGSKAGIAGGVVLIVIGVKSLLGI